MSARHCWYCGKPLTEYLGRLVFEDTFDDGAMRRAHIECATPSGFVDARLQRNARADVSHALRSWEHDPRLRIA